MNFPGRSSLFLRERQQRLLLLPGLAMLALAPSAFAAESPAAPPPYRAPAAPPPDAWPDQRLREFLRALADGVFDRHVVRDEQRAVFGMTYEFWRDGRHCQDAGLDSMHDGAWFTSALITAHRADPAGKHLERLQRYQIPFYVKVLRDSDRLFPEIRRTSEDKAPLTHPWRGRLPVSWDDGGGFDLNTGKPLRPYYNTHQGPNHLAQDVADALLNVWLTTRDPAVAEALLLLHQERSANFGTVPPVAFAAGFANGRPEWTAAVKTATFTPGALTGYSGLYQQNGEFLPCYDDPLAWQYGQAMATASRSGSMDEGFVAFAAARVYGAVLGMELFYDDRSWPYGLHFFDIQVPPQFVAKSGHLDGYASTARKLMGGRGIQFAWVAAGILPELRRRPELWEAYFHQRHGGEPLVRVTDVPPALDGRRDRIYDDSCVLRQGDSSLRLLGDPKHLHAFIESSADTFAFTIRHAGRVNGTAVAAHVAARSDGTVIVTNDLGERLLAGAAFREGAPWSAELSLPYTVVPGQKQWINGAEHGRYAVALNDRAPEVVYMLSQPQRIIARLEAYVDGTIETWHTIWKELGVIPSGYRGPNLRNPSWEISDAGNYAHLIRLIALRLLDRGGRSEWQLAGAQELPERNAPGRRR